MFSEIDLPTKQTKLKLAETKVPSKQALKEISLGFDYKSSMNNPHGYSWSFEKSIQCQEMKQCYSLIT